MKVCVHYRKAAAHNDKAAKADTGSAKSLDHVAWLVIFMSRRSKTHKVLEDVNDIDMGEISIAGPSIETMGQQEDGGGEDGYQQDSDTEQGGSKKKMPVANRVLSNGLQRYQISTSFWIIQRVPVLKMKQVHC